MHRLLTAKRIGQASPIAVIRGALKLELSIQAVEAPSEG
jgi:hypothetical protein